MLQNSDEPLSAPPQSSGHSFLDSPSIRNLVICLGLILAIFSIYAQVRHFKFVDLDDLAYIAGNPHVEEGLRADSIKWAFTAVASGNWIPVTLLSHVLDGQLFGMRTGFHHLSNVLYHMLAAMFLFAALQRATGETGASAFVAFMFAVHPLHVESVAWVAERKDVLSALFLFLALYAYVRYTERPSLGRYLAIMAAFALGLMAKPMLVTFPFLLLLFDFWPLRRVEWPKMVWEKLPLFALSVLSSIITYQVQHSAGAFSETALGPRIENALISYIIYIRQTLWPEGLIVFYPYSESIALWQPAVALAVLAGVSGLTILAWRTRPYLAVGWFWYLGTLVPVIGLVQAGQQAHADRYTYLPMIGLSMMAAWGAVEVGRRWPRSQSAIVLAAAACCFVWIVLSTKQTFYWRDSEALFQRAIDASQNNWATESNLGVYLSRFPERRAEAIEHFESALRIKPDYPQAQNNLGWCLLVSQLYGPAITHLEAALRLKPDFPEANESLARALMESGRYTEAIPHFEAAIRANPDDINRHFGLGLDLSKIPGRNADAIAQYQIVLRLHPEDGPTHYNLGLIYESLGRTEEAIGQFEAAQRIAPDPEMVKRIEGLRGLKLKPH